MGGNLAIVNIGAVFSGDLAAPMVNDADTIIVRDGLIESVGRLEDVKDAVDAAELKIDAAGVTVAPGLIDSHCHVVLGDYTPRQKTVDFLASYVHGGITSCVSPGEIHAPGRPHTASGVKALAVVAKETFDNLRPGGMRVHAGAVVLEPTLTREDFAELQAAGVRLAKFGFGRYHDPADGVDQVRWAQEHGITVMCHSGGASIPGSKPITPDHLLLLHPDVCGHVNGGPTSLDPDGVDRVMDETEMALQLVQAGNLSSSLRILNRAVERDVLHRVVIGSDTPTGTGVMPLGMIKTVAELSSLCDLEPARVWALATGNCADVWDLPSGRIAPGRAADLVLMDAPWGSRGGTAAEALALGDIPGISCVVTDGKVRALRSRNTPAAARSATTTPELPHLTEGH
ncbi:amidohydrolase family protein [Enemella sp. A6]|uniref:amidohydrolase family protein n=1 Tax=Enemella sp. A6 TaxID=3440152 RepID=UPI003EC02195